jgi:hypothetical protein
LIIDDYFQILHISYRAGYMIHVYTMCMYISRPATLCIVTCIRVRLEHISGENYDNYYVLDGPFELLIVNVWLMYVCMLRVCISYVLYQLLYVVSFSTHGMSCVMNSVEGALTRARACARAHAHAHAHTHTHTHTDTHGHTHMYASVYIYIYI